MDAIASAVATGTVPPLVTSVNGGGQFPGGRLWLGGGAIHGDCSGGGDGGGGGSDR
ncbi:hypothetical protein MMPV_003738 [Pyropia vietnamensis]